MSDKVVFPASFGLEFASQISGVFDDCSFAKECLVKDDWRCRCAGIEVLAKFWKLDALELFRLCELLMCDRSVEVRSMAILMMSNCFDTQCLPRLTRLLFNVTNDSSKCKREQDSARHVLSMLRRNQIVDSSELMNDTKNLIAETEEFLNQF